MSINTDVSSWRAVGTPDSGVASREPQVRAALNTLIIATGELDKIISELEKRLEPVLQVRATPPSNPRDEKAVLVPVAEAIDSERHNVRAAVEHIEFILSRLEV